MKMSTFFRKHLSLCFYSAFILLSACGDDKNKDNNNNNNGSCPGCGGNGSLAIQATADLTGAYGLLVVDKDENASLALMDEHNKTAEKLGLKDAPRFELKEDDGLALLDDGKKFNFPISSKNLELAEGDSNEAVMQKIDKESGDIKDALTQEKPENSDVFNPNQKLPKLKTIAVSTTGEVYLHFENPFIYKSALQNEDPWNRSNGYQCQIFKIKGGTLDDLLTTAPSHDNLECVDNAHFIDSWRNFGNGIFQFDNAGNLYYPGSLPDNNKMVVYRVSRDGSEQSEVINANICVENFLITPPGGVFYTGQTCQNGQNQGGGGGGFFRYVAPGTDGQILEIARDWWNFIFTTAVTTDDKDSAVFFGPDPRNANTASWNSACLFNFDPSKTDSQDRTSEVITCGADIWNWMELRRPVDVTTYGEGYNNYTGNANNYSPSLAWKKEYKRRCESDDEVFAGGGSQISSIKQDSTGQIYVIGNIRKKVEGAVSCSVEFRGPHCVIDSNPVLTNSSSVAYTEASCVSDSGTWVNTGRCTNGTNKAAGCVDHTRTWTAGYCSNPDYVTKASCEAVTGCSNRYYTTSGDCTGAGYNWGSLVWRTGRCSSDQDIYETQTTCEGASKVWTTDEWSGSCTSTDATENASLFNNDKNSCIPEWQTETVWYNKTSGSLCTTAETGARDTWYDGNSVTNNFAQTASDTRSVYADLSGKFLVNRLECAKASDATSSNGEWTEEYAAMAKVNATKKTLELTSLQSEKAIKLWIVEDKPYYSSYDTNTSQYTLSGLKTGNICVDPSIKKSSDCSAGTWSERQCVLSAYTTQTACEDASKVWQDQYPYTILSNFEVYNLAESGDANALFADGLNFSSNQYQFGTIDTVKKELALKQGLTGTLKTIVILPKK